MSWEETWGRNDACSRNGYQPKGDAVLSSGSQIACRIPGCEQDVPFTLAAEALCPDHFLQHAFLSAQQALERCQMCLPVDSRTMDWLFSSAAFIAHALTRRAEYLPQPQRDGLLELLLCLTNLHEYVKHHSVVLKATE